MESPSKTNGHILTALVEEINAKIRENGFDRSAHALCFEDHKLSVVASLITKGKEVKSGLFLIEVKEPSRADILAMKPIALAHITDRPHFDADFIGKLLRTAAGRLAPRLG